MKLSTIPKDFIINAAVESRAVVSNFLLHGLRIKNDSKDTIILKEINFELYASQKFVKTVTYREKALDKTVKEFSEWRKWLGEGFGAELFLGEEGFFAPDCYAETPTLKANEETGIFNEYFIVVSDKAIDEINIKVTYIQNGEEQSKEHILPVIKYHNKNEYIFPLKGTLSTCGNFGSLMDHRQHYSMEFAIDMAQYNEEQKLEFKEDMKQEDYVIFGKDILAIADGEVVDCFSEVEKNTSWDREERKPYIDKYGCLPAQCGNYVVIKHEHGEYSFYGHMVTGSVTISKGDMIKQGQTIGKVGHTGMSNCPHLHFQLMDGPDFYGNRGLPCSFTNLKDVAGNPISFIEEENIIVHAE